MVLIVGNKQLIGNENYAIYADIFQETDTIYNSSLIFTMKLE